MTHVKEPSVIDLEVPATVRPRPPRKNRRLWWLAVPMSALLAIGGVVFNTSPAFALATPSIQGWRDANYANLVLSFGGTTSCWNLTGTGAMNDVSSVKGYNLKQWDPSVNRYRVWEITGYNHGDCTDYLFTLGNGSTTQLNSLGAYPCYCNDQLSGFRIRQIS